MIIYMVEQIISMLYCCIVLLLHRYYLQKIFPIVNFTVKSSTPTYFHNFELRPIKFLFSKCKFLNPVFGK